MTITLGTIFILIFFLPGFLFTKAYYYSPFSRKFSKSSVFGEFASVIIPSVLIHLIGLITIHHFWNNYFKHFNHLLLLVLESFKAAPNYSSDIDCFPFIVVYSIILWVCSLLMGIILNGFVRQSYLDKTSPLFRFDNEWFYYLSGEAHDFPSVKLPASSVWFVEVDVLATTNDRTVLYTGICSDYHLDENGGLSSICLTYPGRWRRNDKGVMEIRDINSNLLVIPNSTIVNINVRYRTFAQKNPEKNKAELIQDYIIGTLLIGTFLSIIVFFLNLILQPRKLSGMLKSDSVNAIFSAMFAIGTFICYKTIVSFWIGFIAVFFIIAMILPPIAKKYFI